MRDHVRVGLRHSTPTGMLYHDGTRLKLQRGAGQRPVVVILVAIWAGTACGLWMFLNTRGAFGAQSALLVGLVTAGAVVAASLVVSKILRIDAARRYPPLTLASVTAEKESRHLSHGTSYHARVVDTEGDWWDLTAHRSAAADTRRLVSMLPPSRAPEPPPWITSDGNVFDQMFSSFTTVTRHDRHAPPNTRG